MTPGYIRELLPDEAPVKGEKWDDIFKDVERVIMPGVIKVYLNFQKKRVLNLISIIKK